MMVFTETCYIPDMADESTYQEIEMMLSAIQGVRRVVPVLAARRLVITYESPATPETLREILEANGYAVTNGLTPLRPPS